MFIVVISYHAWPHTWGITWRPPRIRGVYWRPYSSCLFPPDMHKP